MRVDPDKPGEGEEDTRTVAEIAVAAFDGVEESDDDDDQDDDAGADGDAGEGDDGDGGDPDAGAAAETEEQKAAREAAEAEAAKTAEVDNAVKELGLKGSAETRFRELSGRVRELSEKLETFGGDEGLQRLQRDAKDQREWDQKLNEIGCTPDQFGQAIGLIAAINLGTPEALAEARKMLVAEVAALDAKLGNKSEHHNPLDAHADLKSKVEAGTLDEEDALEIARLRSVGTQRQQAEARHQGQEEAARIQQEGIQSLSQVGATLKARDGQAVFDATMGKIKDRLNAICAKLPPSEWAGTASELYELAKVVPAPAPPQAPRPGGKQPMRQSHGTQGAGHVSKEHTDAMSAFDAGVEEVRSAGR